jgi:hypothetical protein
MGSAELVGSSCKPIFGIWTTVSSDSGDCSSHSIAWFFLLSCNIQESLFESVLQPELMGI